MSSSRNTALPLNTCLTASVGFKVHEEGKEVESDDGTICVSNCDNDNIITITTVTWQPSVTVLLTVLQHCNCISD